MIQKHLTSAAMTDRSFCKTARPNGRDEMSKKAGWLSAGLTFVALATAATVSLGAGSAQAAVVYCKTLGVPKGCVVRPTPVVVAPVAAVAVVTPGVGAPGVGVRAGTPMNRGGPVNRVGRR